MNDGWKWILVTLVATVLAYLGGSALGLDWTQIQVNMLGLLELVGTLLLLFTGSAAAIEVAGYYRRKNRRLDAEAQAEVEGVREDDLRRLLKEVVDDALAERTAPSLPEPDERPLRIPVSRERDGARH